MIFVYTFLFFCIAGVGGWFAWQYFGSSGSLFGNNRETRIGVSEIVSIDSKRKLMLIHRDGIEHLVMTGGPVDVVIEQGIQQRRPQPAAVPMQVQSYEPRLATKDNTAHAQNGLAQNGLAQNGLAQNAFAPEANPDVPPGFGRLRQRGSPAPDAYQRPDAPNFTPTTPNR